MYLPLHLPGQRDFLAEGGGKKKERGEKASGHTLTHPHPPADHPEREEGDSFCRTPPPGGDGGGPARSRTASSALDQVAPAREERKKRKEGKVRRPALNYLWKRKRT